MVDKAGDATSKTMDDAEEGMKGKKKDKTSKKTDDNDDEKESQLATQDKKVQEQPQTLAAFKNYDFVPGDKTIFQCDFAGERDSELPSRLTLFTGNAEVQTHGGEKVLNIPAEGDVYFNPQMKTNKYLPEQFTIEFDVLAQEPEGGYHSDLYIFFRKAEDAERSDYASVHHITLSDLNTSNGSVYWDEAGKSSNLPLPATVRNESGKWKHIAIYVNKNIGKLYVDQHRVRAVNNLKTGVEMVTFATRDDKPVLIKNIRIAQGGDDAYNKIITDGKFIAYGILFDVNKASLKPESMGTINEIAKMLKDHSDLKFEIGGHTDSDGSAELNNKLSQERADAVKNQLTTMGIDAGRLTSKGYGAAKPLNDNKTPENKANNRRVEFVKQ